MLGTPSKALRKGKKRARKEKGERGEGGKEGFLRRYDMLWMNRQWCSGAIQEVCI
jgi:hypothetical protein